jgi:ATP-dependent exoDNAse (exonuclease V) beta subunit (contains helicase and exonuclease domains)
MYNCFPGTGKSLVIVNLIIQILYAQKQYRKRGSRRNVPRILVCAPSNAAIDEVVIRLLRIRQSIQSRYDPSVHIQGYIGVNESSWPMQLYREEQKCSVGFLLMLP